MKLKNRILHSSFIFILLISGSFQGVKAQKKQVFDKRMAGFHNAVVTTGEIQPSSAVLTYPVKKFDYQNYNFLVKLMPCLSLDGKIIYPSDFKNVKVEDFPGGVEASFSYQNTRVMTRITPLLSGRGSKTWKGAALYEISTSPASEVIVLLGKGSTINLIWGFMTSTMLKDSTIGIDGITRINKETIGFHSGIEDLNVIVKGSAPVVIGDLDGRKEQAYVRFTGGSGYILTAFSDFLPDMKAFTRMNFAAEKEKVTRYYKDMNVTRLETPDTLMNQAFTSAMYNLEYSWLEPFGWGECLHHWLALWHMQVGAAADLIGQADRSRSCILEHAHHLLKDGSVPQFMPNKIIKKDFGGSNQYWVWQVRHYLNNTADKAFAKEIIPYVDTVIAQTLKEYDKDGDMLPSWGLQIGNQEDFLGNPYNGSVPSMELYNMFMTRAELSKLIGDSASASLWFSKAGIIHDKLYKELWINDLGRFGYYKDPTGKVMLDGQYQTYLYPVIYNIVDEYDKYSGLRHLRDRLTGEDGAIFLSNNFPWHVTGGVSTWGMQSGTAQQPWGAAGFSKTGLNNETWKPLKAMAEWAQDINHRGSWPETGPEPTPAYFTPPAGLYLVAVTEDLFGINVHAPEGYMEISPSLPDHWPYANLNLPDFNVKYTKNNNLIEYALSSTKELPLKVRWRLPVSRIKKCTVNNKDVRYTIEPGVNHIILCFDVPHTAKSVMVIEFEPVNYQVKAPRSVATAEKLDISINGATIDRVMDRYGVLENIRMNSASSFSAKIQSGLLYPYLSYNQLGLLNFSRRTFFMDCRTPDGLPFIAAVDLNILPRFEAAPLEKQADSNSLRVTVRNNTDEPFTGNANICITNTSFLVPVKLPSRSDQVIDIPLQSGLSLSAGDNIASFSLPGEAPVSIHFTRDDKTTGKSVRFVSIELPAKDLIADTLWNTLRVMPGHPHIFFTFTNYGWPRPMEALKNVTEVVSDQIPGLKFKIPGRHFIPVSHLAGKVSYKLELGKKKCKKIYLLVLPFVDNHNMFSSVANISVYANNEIVYTRTLHYPGDVDYWVPNRNPTSFATFREPRPSRFELLPLLDKDMTDWKEGKPPVFPQSKWWSTSLPLVTESCLMNIIEINLEKPAELDNLVFEVLGVMPAFGIVGATVELSE